MLSDNPKCACIPCSINNLLNILFTLTERSIFKGVYNLLLFTVNTDKETVGEALLEHELIAGEDGQYGLYIKTVNGITADYDVDQSYWAFYADGEYAMAGVDMTEIDEDVTYQLAYTK